MQLRLENPEWCLGLLIVLGFAALMFWKGRQLPLSFSWRRFGLVIAALVFLVIGLSRPQLGQRVTSSASRGSQIFFAIDISRSMLAQDTTPSRLQFAVTFAQKLLQQLSGVRVAIFPFAVDGYLQIPLTTDVMAAGDMLSMLSPSVTTQQGTDFSQSLSSLLGQINRLELQAKEKGTDWLATQVVLISDGETHRKLRPEVVQQFRAKHIPIFVVATGTTAGAQVPVEGRFGQFRDRLRDTDGRPVFTRLDAATLRMVSDLSGGDYFAPRFDEVYRLRDRIGQSMALGKLTTSFQLEKEFFPFFFIAAVLCLCLEISRGRWEYALRALLISLAIAGGNARADDPSPSPTPPSAIDAYNLGVKEASKNPQKAAELFQESIMMTDDNRVKKRALYNLGNTLLKLGDPIQALNTYQQARDMKSSDGSFDKDADARISQNMELAAKILEEMMKQAQQGGDNQNDDDGDGKKAKNDDPKGSKKDYDAQIFNEAQKKKIFDLLASDEQQTLQRLQEQRNRNKPTPPTEKPW